ncbi:MAG TPA: ATP-binding protein [Tepidisphaeraceae bacterium]|jgi:signal transduction histidine kinase
MFGLGRHLHISLAAKCQLLFGSAVVLIIAAALSVPWWRMEQLMDQINERAAGTVAQTAKEAHAATGKLPLPTTKPSRAMPARLLGVDQDDLATHFEKEAIAEFLRHPDARPITEDYVTRGGARRYRYAQALFGTAASCQGCHESGRKGELMGIVSVDIESGIESNQQLLNRVFLLMAVLLAGSIAIFVFFFITDRFILRPVRVLQDAAEKVSQGDLNIRSHISTGDEFQQLSQTLNTMLANLKEGEDQLRSLNAALDLKVGELSATNVALFESNRLKSEFLANVSHELRTPLNSILGFAELLRESAATDGKTGRYVQNILSSGKNLLELINDLLDLAKIEAGRMEVRAEPLSLPDLFEGLTNILKPLCEDKNVRIEMRVPADVPVMKTDPAKLQQVLYNLLANAIEFSPVGDEILLTAVREAEAWVRITVVDHGPGIAEDKQSLIFEKFRQIDGGVTREHSGTGLGLAISRELMGLIGGEIGVISQLGHGATFWIVMPLVIEAELKDVR